ncbi:hypothetical protein SPRG_09745 [Saprolegnia parasitica CBS 223.65]|uniref:Uncharacterized protein n=1 Tax=Saprolegnia parasitica (strain CBS 223.65) TaxID=695850 RepID=A0A067C773_SAPPC|nr:hypothetical protein SPRG_09745 [Saprolegnia parasitica CBS 223.65]KDO25015.1 hypothetical protein SPRG_09745 [Saprolegnia parasitica CBS 223.65]|eukprot:XP_012204284.1 hypothetical protein SPRG_09745 [Saprolegnia parasitica CBS 223.65]
MEAAYTSAFALDATSAELTDDAHAYEQEMALDRYMQSPDKDDDADTDVGSMTFLPPTLAPATSLKDEKRRRLLAHPMVLSVSTDGREVACKCGRIVRLNPPWYMLKYDQHTMSRNCGEPRPSRKRTALAQASVSADVDTILAQGEPGPDASVLDEHRFRVAQQLREHPKFVALAPDGLSIECRCNRLVHLEGPWQPAAFFAHVESDVCDRPVQRKRRRASPPPPPSSVLALPCPGIRSPDVAVYVRAAVQVTGGSRPRHTIARELFPRLLPPGGPCEMAKLLCPTEKKLLHDALQREALWWIDKDAGTVRSLQCTGAATRTTSDATRLPCAKCSHLRSIPSFRTAVASANKPPKALRQTKFIPKSLGPASAVDALLVHGQDAYVRELRDLLAQHASDATKCSHVWLHAAEVGLRNELADHPVLLAVLEWIVHLKEKERRGVGKQNMPISPALDAFHAALADLSEDAATLFSLHFCGRSKRSRSRKSDGHVLSLLPPDAALGDLMLSLPPSDDPPSDNDDHDLVPDEVPLDDPIAPPASTVLAQREAAWAIHSQSHPNEEIPCPGITAVHEFVSASFQPIGGSRPRYVLAKDYAPDALVDGKLVLSALTPAQADVIHDAAFRESLWRIDKHGKCVRSRRCLRSCTRALGACDACRSLHRNATFRSAVSRARKKAGDPASVLANVKFTPHAFTKHDPLLRAVAGNPSLRSLVLDTPRDDDRGVFWLKLARLGLGGAFREFSVVEGVLASVLDVKDKARRGVGKQNMTYTPALDAFLEELAATSLPAFELFAGHFCVRSLRSSKLLGVGPSDDEPMAMPAILMYSDDDETGHSSSDRLLTDAFLGTSESALGLASALARLDTDIHGNDVISL